jgi:hypothetical protein
VTSNLNIPRTEIECFYENGEEVRPTAQQILNLQAAILEDKAKKSKLRSEKAARKKAVKDQLERLEKGEALADAPIVAPEKKSKRSTDKSKKKTTSSAVEPAANSNGKKGHPDDELDTAGDGSKPRRRKRQDPYKTSCNRKKKKKYSDDSDSGNE